jgi:hypothetical protein
MSLVFTSVQENVRKPTLATEMGVVPWGLIDTFDSIKGLKAQPQTVAERYQKNLLQSRS